MVLFSTCHMFVFRMHKSVLDICQPVLGICSYACSFPQLLHLNSFWCHLTLTYSSSLKAIIKNIFIFSSIHILLVYILFLYFNFLNLGEIIHNCILWLIQSVRNTFVWSHLASSSLLKGKFNLNENLLLIYSLLHLGWPEGELWVVWTFLVNYAVPLTYRKKCWYCLFPFLCLFWEASIKQLN